jgi:CrcB protein
VIALYVAVGGAVGSLLRYWCSGVVANAFGETFPLGTLAVNVVGSALIGVVAVATGPDGRLLVDPEIRQMIMVGLFGGFTTFSSFSLQTLALLQDGEVWLAGLNVGLSVVLCLVGVWLGAIIGQMLVR